MSKKVLSYGRQSIGPSDVAAVVRTLRSDWLTQGPAVARFEEAFARYCGAPYAVAVSSGTAGLHLACLAAGLGPGDCAVTSPLTFVATANAALYCGAEPRFADILDEDLGLDPDAAFKEKAKAVLPVHFAGLPCRIGTRPAHGARRVVIEDACHALGAEYRDGKTWRRVGSCAHSDMAVFSFHPVKHLTTGEGGMITTRSRELYERLRRLRSHGIERDPARFRSRSARTQPWHYEMTELGFNYRLTDVQSALGLSQLARVDAFIRRRRAIAADYDRAFEGLSGVRTPARPGDRRSSYHLYALRVDYKALGTDRASFMRDLRARGVGSQVHYIPVPLQPYYRDRFGYAPGDYPSAERAYEEILSVPMHPGLTAADVRRVIAAVRALASRRRK